ncbi:hypothetical protein D1AOALGA4SA_6260 [Olavius algarvensis Delta 1 endosymbiont]|nr:hypothetical protein D1AOALGA4SA_6260 [Olavius algarvensis Delta 1 endosymbiont]
MTDSWTIGVSPAAGEIEKRNFAKFAKFHISASDVSYSCSSSGL